MTIRSHLAAALRWRPGAVPWPACAAAALGTGAPVALAAACGELQTGMAAALGGLMIGGIDMAGVEAAGGRSAPHAVAGVLLPAVAAVVTSAAVAGRGWPGDAALVALAGSAALAGGLSRPLATAATRYLLFLVLAAAMLDPLPEPLGAALLVLSGAAWAAAVNLMLAGVVRRPPPSVAPDPPRPTWRQSLGRWRRSLGGWPGWQYPARLALCLGVAELLARLWPQHHLTWVGLTVALLVERPVERLPIRLTQRAAGTALGVAATAPMLAWQPPAWAVAVYLAMLAGLRPWARAGSYLLYSAAMTPLVLAILDAGAPPTAGLLADRLLATGLGAVLVIAANRAAIGLDRSLGT